MSESDTQNKGGLAKTGAWLGENTRKSHMAMRHTLFDHTYHSFRERPDRKKLHTLLSNIRGYGFGDYKIYESIFENSFPELYATPEEFVEAIKGEIDQAQNPDLSAAAANAILRAKMYPNDPCITVGSIVNRLFQYVAFEGPSANSVITNMRELAIRVHQLRKRESVDGRGPHSLVSSYNQFLDDIRIGIVNLSLKGSESSSALRAVESLAEMHEAGLPALHYIPHVLDNSRRCVELHPFVLVETMQNLKETGTPEALNTIPLIGGHWESQQGFQQMYDAIEDFPLPPRDRAQAMLSLARISDEQSACKAIRKVQQQINDGELGTAQDHEAVIARFVPLLKNGKGFVALTANEVVDELAEKGLHVYAALNAFSQASGMDNTLDRVLDICRQNGVNCVADLPRLGGKQIEDLSSIAAKCAHALTDPGEIKAMMSNGDDRWKERKDRLMRLEQTGLLTPALGKHSNGIGIFFDAVANEIEAESQAAAAHGLAKEINDMLSPRVVRKAPGGGAPGVK